MIGRLGDEAVAAAALAHTVFFVCFTFGMGLVSAVAPLAAQAFGARNPRHGAARAARRAVGGAVDLAADDGVSAVAASRSCCCSARRPRPRIWRSNICSAWRGASLPALWFLAIRGFMGAVNRPEPGLWITLAAIPANAVLVYLLIHGELGLPRLELFGAGLGRPSIVNFGMFLAACGLPMRRRPFQEISRARAHLAHRLAR